MVDYISRESVREKLDQVEKFFLIDITSPTSYTAFHLPQSYNIPFSREDFIDEVRRTVSDKTNTVVLYAIDERSREAVDAARALEQEGYQRVYVYRMGKEDWKNAGYRGGH